MARKSDKTITKELNNLQLVSEDEIRDQITNVEASLTLNPYVRWAKFILTDDQPNGNGDRVPLEEFDNLIQSGINMPIKMAEGRIEEDHSDATPIGVITHLTKEVVDGVNRIIGLAALWLNERPGDVSYIKSLMDDGEIVPISWELGVQERVRQAGGISDLVGVTMKAATIVGTPAYMGRTRLTALASKTKWSDKYVDSLPDSSFLYIERRKEAEGKLVQKRFFPVKDDKGFLDENKLKEVLTEAEHSEVPEKYLGSIKEVVTELLARVEAGASLEKIGDEVAPLENIITEEDTVELEEAKNRVTELEQELATLKASIAEKEDALGKANESLASLNTEKESLASELEELRTFKKQIDDEVAKVEKLDAIKAKFAEASLSKDETYFEENSEKLLSLDADALEFMIQEFVAFSKTDASASLEKGKVPNLPGESTSYDVHEIAKALKERKSK